MAIVDERKKYEKSLTESGVKTLLSKLKTWLSTKAVVFSATKLNTARKISIGGGVLKYNGADGSANFNGTGNISININQVKDSGITINPNVNKVGTVSAIAMQGMSIFNANRFAFIHSDCVTIEKSIDGGETWTHETYTETELNRLTTTYEDVRVFSIGGRDKVDDETTPNYKLRITINAKNGYLYTTLTKIFIRVSTSGCTGSKCDIEKALIANPDSFEMWMPNINLAGWSGWNEISLPQTISFGGGDNQTNQVRKLRLTFSVTGTESKYPKGKLSIYGIYGMGNVVWTHPSELARSNHLYKVETNRNAKFPGSISLASTDARFIGSLKGSLDKETTDSDGDVFAKKYVKLHTDNVSLKIDNSAIVLSGGTSATLWNGTT